MAEIAVERKRITPWWVWALIACLVALLIWFIAARDREIPAGEAERGRLMEPVRDLSTIFSSDNVSLLVDRRVEIPGLRVLSVTGDRLFWVGANESRQVLVELGEVPQGQLPEDRYNVNPGQVLTLYGHIEKFPGWEAARTRWNADPAYKSNFEQQRVYIHASKVDITHRP